MGIEKLLRKGIAAAGLGAVLLTSTESNGQEVIPTPPAVVASDNYNVTRTKEQRRLAYEQNREYVHRTFPKDDYGVSINYDIYDLIESIGYDKWENMDESKKQATALMWHVKPLYRRQNLCQLYKNPFKYMDSRLTPEQNREFWIVYNAYRAMSTAFGANAAGNFFKPQGGKITRYYAQELPFMNLFQPLCDADVAAIYLTECTDGNKSNLNWINIQNFGSFERPVHTIQQPVQQSGQPAQQPPKLQRIF